MSLQGSLDTFAIPDVLALLSATRKSGELRVGGQHGAGRLWLADGQVVAAEVGETTEPVDALFELLRLPSGSFTFDGGAEPPHENEPQAVDALVAEAQTRLDEWRIIEAVVPSLGTRVQLSAEPPAPRVVIDGQQWVALVAVAEGRSVAAVADRLDLAEFAACRRVKELVDAGLVDVAGATEGEPRRPSDPSELVEIPARARRRPPRPDTTQRAQAGTRAPGEAADPVPAPMARELAATLGPEAVEAARAALANAAPEEREAVLERTLTDENGEPINRSLLLKFLSSVRS